MPLGASTDTRSQKTVSAKMEYVPEPFSLFAYGITLDYIVHGGNEQVATATNSEQHRKESGVKRYIYDAKGKAVGFVQGGFIHTLGGQPVGQLNGSHVHKLSGQYVGELHKDMIVDKHLGNLGNIGHPGNPGNAGNPGNPGNRGVVNYGYPDVFHKLLE